MYLIPLALHFWELIPQKLIFPRIPKHGPHQKRKIKLERKVKFCDEGMGNRPEDKDTAPTVLLSLPCVWLLGMSFCDYIIESSQFPYSRSSVTATIYWMKKPIRWDTEDSDVAWGCEQVSWVSSPVLSYSSHRLLDIFNIGTVYPCDAQ